FPTLRSSELSHREALQVLCGTHITAQGSGVCVWRSSPRPISTGQLNALLRLHFRPINLVIFQGSYPLWEVGDLILRGASRLDAFSVYPCRTWLSSHAPGGTTG